uniref:Mitochondrial import inner membrane translocase subunit Tim21 n=1 Tax=Globodera pallida TaxID=36090 RepID=A0A183C2F4_GLOPA
MLPPDPEKGSGFRKAAGGTQQSTESLGTIQKAIRYAEKDDLLLYITAAFGIFMPAVMYFFYRTSGKQFAYKLADGLQRFDPLVAKISAKELEKARWPKTIQIFVVADEDVGEGPPTQFSEFTDWLDEVRYEHRKKNYLRDVKFCILYLTRNISEATENGEIADSEPFIGPLEQRLRSLSATCLRRRVIRMRDDNRSEEKKQSEEICSEFGELLCRFYYGEFDGLDEPEGNVSTAECSTSEESD